ncbi:MAG: acetyltransferase [Burkholderiales bacterium]
MRRYDVFNGDADGICALHQLRLAEPADAALVTGVKRDIALLGRVPAAAGDLVTVLDVSLDRNRAALLGLLERGVKVRWFDHHYAGEVPAHPGLQADIDTARGVCTSMLVDRYLGGPFRAWAVVAAFGDGLEHAARALAATLALNEQSVERLAELGRSINYNAYGESVADLVMPPEALYRSLAPHVDPLEFIDAEPACARLEAARRADLALAASVPPRWTRGAAALYLLPDAAWARRVGGTYANQLAQAEPARWIALLVPRSAGGYLVSVRAAAGAARGADELCRQFGGGGRGDAAGIDHLPESALQAFERSYADACA